MARIIIILLLSLPVSLLSQTTGLNFYLATDAVGIGAVKDEGFFTFESFLKVNKEIRGEVKMGFHSNVDKFRFSLYPFYFDASETGYRTPTELRVTRFGKVNLFANAVFGINNDLEVKINKTLIFNVGLIYTL